MFNTWVASWLSALLVLVTALVSQDGAPSQDWPREGEPGADAVTYRTIENGVSVVFYASPVVAGRHGDLIRFVAITAISPDGLILTHTGVVLPSKSWAVGRKSGLRQVRVRPIDGVTWGQVASGAQLVCAVSNNQGELEWPDHTVTSDPTVIAQHLMGTWRAKIPEHLMTLERDQSVTELVPASDLGGIQTIVSGRMRWADEPHLFFFGELNGRSCLVSLSEAQSHPSSDADIAYVSLRYASARLADVLVLEVLGTLAIEYERVPKDA